jgi:hypothetical protein
MACVEDNWLDRKSGFLSAFLRSMVHVRKEEAGRDSRFVLVAQSGGFLLFALLRAVLPERFRLHFRLRVHLDPLCPESDVAQAFSRGSPVCHMPKRLFGDGEVLLELRCAP